MLNAMTDEEMIEATGAFLTKDRKLKAKVDLLVKSGVRLNASILDLNTPMADVLGQFNFPE